VKYLIFSLLMTSVFSLKAQEVVFKVEVSSENVLLDNTFEVRFTIENAGGDFEAPDFEGFEVISGPNTSSSFSMVNGNVTQKASYTYRLRPVREGKMYIQPATFKTKNETLETEPLIVFVNPNPEGVIEHKGFDVGRDNAFPDMWQSKPRKADPLKEKRRKI
jgi:hypothetical protein